MARIFNAMIVALVALVAIASSSRASAEENRRYTMLSLGYEAASARYHIDSPSGRDADVSALNHLAPRLELINYGIDWFLKIEAGDLGLVSPSSGGRARYSSDFIAGGEVGVHWATIPFGILAVGLKAAGARVGVTDAASGHWTVGGTGFDGGLVVHYAFPLFGFVRVDPALSGGGSYLVGNGGRASGVWSRGALELFIKIAPWTSVQVTGGMDLRSYSPADAKTAASPSFDGRILRAGIGLAFHDVFGLGANDF